MQKFLASFLNPVMTAFYGCSVLAVIALFQGVTSYGSKNLQAPQEMGGIYRIPLPASLNCQTAHSAQEPSEVLLYIQQSGIYLNGALASGKLTPAQLQEVPLTLTGRLSQVQVQLSGVAQSHFCSSPLSMTLQATLEGEKLVGRLGLDRLAQPVSFSAQREKLSSSSESH